MKELFIVFIGIFALSNPLGNLPIFVSLTAHYSTPERRVSAVKIALSFCVFTILFVFAGNSILDFFGISIAAFRIGGGIVLLLIGLAMLQGNQSAVHEPSESDHKEAMKQQDITLVPMTIPMLAGPGVLCQIINLSHEYTGPWISGYLSAACLIVGAIIGILFLLADYIMKILNNNIINVFTRIMGLIIVSIACTLILGGLAGAFPTWLHA